jgi:poly-gamma-glutamate capsule biosynthesis protein CapA/YwtB (metallophosphatase superfamily)
LHRGFADLVPGSGSHLLRGIELYGDGSCHALGNLAGFHNFALGGWTALSAVLPPPV